VFFGPATQTVIVARSIRLQKYCELIVVCSNHGHCSRFRKVIFLLGRCISGRTCIGSTNDVKTKLSLFCMQFPVMLYSQPLLAFVSCCFGA